MRICFVTGLTKFGAERQSSYLAKLLSKRHDVSIVGVVGSGRVPEREGWVAHPSVVRFEMGYLNYYVLSPARLVRALRNLDPDVCIQRAIGDLTGFVGSYCRAFNSRFVYHSAINWDPNANAPIALGLSSSPMSLLCYNLGLLLADAVAAQTLDTARAFKRRFRGMKRIAIIPQVYDAERVRPPAKKSSYALWIGRLTWYKRPEIFLNLARSMPRHRFVMAGSGPMQSYVVARSKALPNLEFLGAIGHEKAERLCGYASVFVNTSITEGFPNTLLEAGARETPFITLDYDPDEVICTNRIGFHSRTIGQLRRDIERVLVDRDLRKELGGNARRYVIDNHAPELALNAYEELLLRMPIKRRKTK